jgi:hypothetical protein
MPYPGVPKQKEKKMERCVANLVSQGKSKSSAIAICRKSIMGGKKLDNLSNDVNKNRKEVNKKESMAKAKNKDIEKDVKKQDEEVVEEEVKEEEAPAEAEAEKPEAEAEEAPAEDESEEEVEEVVEKDEPEADADEPESEEVEEEAEAEEAEDEGEVEKNLDPIEVLKAIKEMKDPAEMREAIQSALEQLTKTDEDGNVKQASNIALDVTTKLEGLMRKLDHIESTMVKQDEPEAEAPEAEEGKGEEAGESEEVSAEADATEEAPEDTPADEPEKEEPADESIEKVAKVEGTLTKVVGEVSEIRDALTKLSADVKKIAEQPVESKVQSPQVVSKTFEIGEEGESRLKEIAKELEEITKVRETDVARYNRENLADKAFKLLGERERLNSGL